MGIFDYIKDVAGVLSTRSGRETMLGIPANKMDRALRERALQEFCKNNPEFLTSGNLVDFDGYVQFIHNGEKCCEFIEGENNCWNAHAYYREKYGYDKVFFDVISKDEIPQVKNLFSDYHDKLSQSAIVEKYLINVVLAQIWLDLLFKNKSQENQNKLLIMRRFEDLISNHEIPFYSISEIQRYGCYTELLVVSKIMETDNIALSVDDPYINLAPVIDSSFERFKYKSSAEANSYLQWDWTSIRKWEDYFRYKHGINVSCKDPLGLNDWR
ncbi:hypothetical protein G6732_03040 [Polynucleobacter paneuropaeus]|nr:hypothetical protein [Polynucleobacter paneuropaeus]